MSAELLALLDGLDAAREKATPGPWWAWDRGVGWHLVTEDPTTVGRGSVPVTLPEGMRTDLALSHRPRHHRRPDARAGRPMSARDCAAFAQAVVGAVARELAQALLTAADTIDPPISPRARAEADEELYVPDCFLVDQR